MIHLGYIRNVCIVSRRKVLGSKGIVRGNLHFPVDVIFFYPYHVLLDSKSTSVNSFTLSIRIKGDRYPAECLFHPLPANN